MARKMRKFREGDFVSVSEELTGAPKRKLPGQSDYVSTESATETVSDTAAKPKKQTFAEAFKAARAKAVKEGRDPSKEIFTWGGEKKVARLAGEGASRPAATRRSAAETPKPAAKSGLKPETEKFLNNLRPAMYLNRKNKAFISDKVTPTKKSDYIPVSSLKSQSDAKPSAAAKPAAAAKQDYASKYEARAAEKEKQEKATGSAGARARFKNLLGFGAASDRRAAAAAREIAARKPKSRPLLLTGEEAREANRKLGTIGGKAKGGKIDGCAVRGKTRAGRK